MPFPANYQCIVPLVGLFDNILEDTLIFDVNLDMDGLRRQPAIQQCLFRFFMARLTFFFLWAMAARIWGL